MRFALASFASLALVVGCGGGDPPPAAPTPPPAPAAASAMPPAASSAVAAAPGGAPGGAPGPVSAPKDDRDPEDVKLDAQRKPSELVAFAGITPGMKVADLGAGGGYTTEVLARAVGPTGTVYSQNNQKIVDMFADKPWTARLAKPVNSKVVRVVRDFDDPLPAEAKDLDAVVVVLFYHDTVWMGVDRAKMDKNILKALKPGGKLIVVDHSGRPGSGTTETKTLHRIEEKSVTTEITKAGFKLDKEGTFLKNPDDKRDWNDSPREAGDKRGTSDRFVLSFAKP